MSDISGNDGKDYYLDDNGYKIPVGDKYPHYPVELCDIIQGWKLACVDDNHVACNKRRELMPPGKPKFSDLYRKAGDDKYCYYEVKYGDGTFRCEKKLLKYQVEKKLKSRYATEVRWCDIPIKS